jgi:hypothetical protein
VTINVAAMKLVSTFFTEIPPAGVARAVRPVEAIETKIKTNGCEPVSY